MNGEYVGKDGRTYRWVKNPWSNRCVHQWLGGQSWMPCDFHHENWPVAKAALDELLAEDEWVGIDDTHRIDPTCTRLQTRGYSAFNGKYIWQDNLTPQGEHLKAAYRKGREVALAERDAKVAELVDAAGEMAKLWNRVSAPFVLVENHELWDGIWAACGKLGGLTKALKSCPS